MVSGPVHGDRPGLTTMGVLRKIVLTAQLTVPRAVTGMLSAILSSNFNRITIHELGVAAVIITAMLGIYHFLSPFQVVFGRLADRMPLFGYRRSAYIFLGLLISSLMVALLPPVAVAMGNGEIWAFAVGFVMLIVFGLGFGMSGVTHLSLIADTIPEKERGLQMALTWIALVLSMIVTLVVLSAKMPDYSFDRMWYLYAMTVPIAVGALLFGLWGVEQRMNREETRRFRQQVSERTQDEAAPVRALWDFVVAAFKRNETRAFFLFVFFAMFGTFMQDNILEVFGAQVMDLTVGETGRFQQVWGVGAIVGMLLMGIGTRALSISKVFAIRLGLIGIAVCFFALSVSSVIVDRQMVLLVLFTFGMFNGFFTIGTLSAMFDMTTPEDRGAYLGLWGLAIAYAMGLGSLFGGALVSATIETGLLGPRIAYAGIFVLEGAIVLLALYFLAKVGVERFTHIEADNVTHAMESDVG